MKLPPKTLWKSDLHELYGQLMQDPRLIEHQPGLNERGLRLLRWLRKRYHHQRKSSDRRSR